MKGPPEARLGNRELQKALQEWERSRRAESSERAKNKAPAPKGAGEIPAGAEPAEHRATAQATRPATPAGAGSNEEGRPENLAAWGASPQAETGKGPENPKGGQ